jgi:hypothetical protein
MACCSSSYRGNLDPSVIKAFPSPALRRPSLICSRVLTGGQAGPSLAAAVRRDRPAGKDGESRRRPGFPAAQSGSPHRSGVAVLRAPHSQCLPTRGSAEGPVRRERSSRASAQRAVHRTMPTVHWLQPIEACWKKRKEKARKKHGKAWKAGGAWCGRSSGLERMRMLSRRVRGERERAALLSEVPRYPGISSAVYLPWE